MAWLAGGVVLVLAVVVLASGWLGPRLGLGDRGSSRRRAAPEGVAVVETDPGADGEVAVLVCGRGLVATG